MELLYVGTHGHVRAVHPDTGKDQWTTSLPGSGWEVVSLLYDAGRLFAGSHGKLYCLEPTTGEILWENPLEGLSWDFIALATSRVPSSPHMPGLAAEKERKDRRDAAANA